MSRSPCQQLQFPSTISGSSAINEDDEDGKASSDSNVGLSRLITWEIGNGKVREISTRHGWILLVLM
jgi:hypothetical protein